MKEMDLEIRELTTLEDFQTCIDIQKIVWGFDDPYDIVPQPLLIVSQRMDGVILGAFLKEEMIGFVYSLPGTHQGRKGQWSHMLAVLAEYRNSDIGYRLKLAQYEESRRKGYEFIEWTFDPLESRNAYFNLRKLGCTAEEYEVNIYGITSSPLHGGMPTDRLIAHWAIPRIEKTTPDLNSVPEPPALVTKTKTDAQGVLRLDEIRLDSSETFLYMEIPEEIQQIKAQSPDAALDWRMKTRRIFQHYLDRGYHVDSFLRLQSRSFYVFRKTTEAQRH